MNGPDGAPARGPGPPDRFRLLFVCTGNICRSPFAQFHTRFLLEARLGPVQAARFQVVSAGTGAVVGSGMHPLSRAQLTTRQDHPDVAAFHSRQLPERDVALADLVLTASREHRGRVLEDVPQALPKAFTLPEFARLLEAAPPGPLPHDLLARARALVALALATRGTPAPVSAEDDAVPDPIRGDEPDHAVAASVIDAAIRPFLDRVVPRLPAPPPRTAGPTSMQPTSMQPPSMQPTSMQPPSMRPPPGPRPPGPPPPAAGRSLVRAPDGSPTG